MPFGDGVALVGPNDCRPKRATLLQRNVRNQWLARQCVLGSLEQRTGGLVRVHNLRVLPGYDVGGRCELEQIAKHGGCALELDAGGEQRLVLDAELLGRTVEVAEGGFERSRHVLQVVLRGVGGGVPDAAQGEPNDPLVLLSLTAESGGELRKITEGRARFEAHTHSIVAGVNIQSSKYARYSGERCRSSTPASQILGCVRNRPFGQATSRLLDLRPAQCATKRHLQVFGRASRGSRSCSDSLPIGIQTILYASA